MADPSFLDVGDLCIQTKAYRIEGVGNGRMEQILVVAKVQ